MLYGYAFGWWDTGPFITRQMEAILILVVYILVWISLNIGERTAKRKIQNFFEGLKQQFKTSHKSIVKIVVSILIVFSLFNPVRWIFFYYIPRYNDMELSHINLKEWDDLSEVEKFRIGQSFYIKWRGKPDGLYKAEDYVSLIDGYIERTPTKENLSRVNIDSVVLYSITGT